MPTFVEVFGVQNQLYEMIYCTVPTFMKRSIYRTVHTFLEMFVVPYITNYCAYLYERVFRSVHMYERV